MKHLKYSLAALVLAGLIASPSVFAEAKPVGITPDLMALEFEHNGAKQKIERNQDNANTINPAFAKTSRACPPFCIQPSSLAPGVETIGELEVIDYVKKMTAGETMSDGSEILVVDSRTPDWVERGTIPGAKNLPWTGLSQKRGASILEISDILTSEFNVEENEGVFTFNNAKTLVMFCNGMWCGQSPANIKTLLSFGYPAHKIKWYRGGMQDWEVLGLTTQ